MLCRCSKRIFLGRAFICLSRNGGIKVEFDRGNYITGKKSGMMQYGITRFNGGPNNSIAACDVCGNIICTEFEAFDNIRKFSNNVATDFIHYCLQVIPNVETLYIPSESWDYIHKLNLDLGYIKTLFKNVEDYREQ